MRKILLALASLAVMTSACSDDGEAARATSKAKRTTSSAVSSTAVPTTTGSTAPAVSTPLNCTEATPQLWPGETSPHLLGPVTAGTSVASVRGLEEALEFFDVPFGPGDLLRRTEAACSFATDAHSPVFLNLSTTGDQYWITGINYPVDEGMWSIMVKGPEVNVGVGGDICNGEPTCSATAVVRYGDVSGSASKELPGPIGQPLIIHVDRDPAAPGRILVRGTAAGGRTVAVSGAPLPPGDFGAG